jgi:hypothetical protein
MSAGSVTLPAAGTPAAFQALAARWSGARPAELANAQSYIIELCEALGVPRPDPSGSEYAFEYPVKLATRDGTETPGRIDCYKRGHFVLEAKHAASSRGDLGLRRAYGQARQYAQNDPAGAPPPYLLVVDVGRSLSVWHRWGGTYQGFAAGHRIELPTLHARPADVALLRDIWLDPARRDPRQRAQAVTKEIAAKLARLASALEGRGFGQERVAKFLMRVVFSCFAEDVGLLPREAFRQTVQRAGVEGDPALFASAVKSLWRAMDEGGMFGYERFLRFNGHFFRDAEALPLERGDIALLLEAAQADWRDVEPTIFGTLLTRALDPVERHRLGAEYTPREFIARLVKPTVEEPVRERWTAVQAAVLQLRATEKPKDRAAAEQRIRDFLAWMRGLRVLDPACGSGNFLYVTMHVLKDIEHEAVQELAALTGRHELRMEEVGPWNFFGIEVKPWAREIADLTLWIGFHQFWMRHNAGQPSEPVLQDTGTLECRDAVLAWDAVVRRPERDRPDPTPRVRHPVTGELVPNPAAVLPYTEYVSARPAEWPDADFIVGNPPYLGSQRQRDVFGDGYVDALRGAYAGVPDSADYVTYWWYRAAAAVASGRTTRAGLITTNSITQAQNRAVIAAAAEVGARVTWAVADHVWYDGADGAEVRVAMTVTAKDPSDARLVTVARADRVRGDVSVVGELRVSRLNADLTAHADVASASRYPLRANVGLSHRGVCLVGDGFVLSAEEAKRLLATDPGYADVIRPLRNGKDLTARPRGVYVIDFALRSESEATQYAVPFDIVRARVRPVREANNDRSRAAAWWRFGRTNENLRSAIAQLPRYIATSMTSKHRTFRFVPAPIVPDQGLVIVAADDPFVLGVLSSAAHEVWALAAGGRMGVRHTPRYNNALCFDPFPFPAVSDAQRQAIGGTALAIEAHRDAALARDPNVTLMKLYDVVSALRAGRALTATESRVYAAGAGGVLRDLHDTLDRQVAEAYGWSWPEPPALVIERLVGLHAVRLEEEAAGTVRWLRPDYQRTRAGEPAEPTISTPAFDLGIEEPADAEAEAPTPRVPWPSDAVGQITVLRTMAAITPLSIEEAVRRLAGAKRDLVARHLETLAILGEVREIGDGRFGIAAGL